MQVLTVLSVGRILVGATGLRLARVAIGLAKFCGRDQSRRGGPTLRKRSLRTHYGSGCVFLSDLFE